MRAADANATAHRRRWTTGRTPGTTPFTSCTRRCAAAALPSGGAGGADLCLCVVATEWRRRAGGVAQGWGAEDDWSRSVLLSQAGQCECGRRSYQGIRPRGAIRGLAVALRQVPAAAPERAEQRRRLQALRRGHTSPGVRGRRMALPSWLQAQAGLHSAPRAAGQRSGESRQSRQSG